MFQVLQSLRHDIKLETVDGTIIFGHKVVLASASPYFHAIFTNFSEKNKDLVVIREITALLLLVNFIYSGKIMVTEENFQVGCNDGQSGEVFNSVECYHTSLDARRPVAEMCKRQYCVGVGVLDGVLYAIGGDDGSETLKSVEAYRPSTGVWTTMADMHLPRERVGVVALEGLLYAVGGRDMHSVFNNVEVYNPITNIWTMLGAQMNVARCLAGVVAIHRPPNF